MEPDETNKGFNQTVRHRKQKQNKNKTNRIKENVVIAVHEYKNVQQSKVLNNFQKQIKP